MSFFGLEVENTGNEAHLDVFDETTRIVTNLVQKAAQAPLVAELASAPTGAVRSTDAAKTRYDLISPIGLKRVAETCHEGAVKYGDHNWEMGFPISDILNHGIRHIYLYLNGDRSEDHLAHAAWNMFAAMHSEEMWPELNKDLRGEGGRLTEFQKSLILQRNEARKNASHCNS